MSATTCQISGIPYAQAKSRGRLKGREEWSTAVREQTSHLAPLAGPCRLRVIFRLPPSKYPTDHPHGMDLDNLLKRFFDALHSTIFATVAGRDGCVTELEVKKVRVGTDEEAGADLEIIPLPF